MKIYITDQYKRFPQHLEVLKHQPLINYNKSNLYKKSSIISIESKKELHQLDLKFFFNYSVFPENIMTSMSEWNFENRNIRVGDTIVQQVFIPPIRSFSQKIILGVRINEIINEPARIGYSYETLKGHVEKGISIFTFEKSEDSKIIFKIQTYSKPGNFLTKILGPVFSIPYQNFCTRQALMNVKKQLEG